MATTAMGVRAAHELDGLYRAHAAEVYRYAYAVLGNRADAEDITQTTFVNALRALERGERPRKPTNWLITIAHNLIRQRYRQQRARPHEVELDRELASFETDDDGPSLDDLVRALQRIPAAQREALVLREMEGRSYKEIAPILGVTVNALETLIFRARRSLADELENLITCDRAELALSKRVDGRLGRAERRRLAAHLEECASCARVAARSIKHRRAFKGLAVLPLPWSLTFFNGAPSASAAVGLPAIGGSAAAVGASGLTAKLAVGLAAVAVAGGAGYETVRAVRDPVPVRPVAATPAESAVAVAAAQPPPVVRAKPIVAAAHDSRVQAQPKAKVKPKPRPLVAKKPVRVQPARATVPLRGRSAAALERMKPVPAAKAARPRAVPPRAKPAQEKPPRRAGPGVAPERGKSATAPGRLTPKAEPTPPKEPRDRPKPPR
jgi:RNA polymerase sigma-70 factor (ECF subfamily)